MSKRRVRTLDKLPTANVSSAVETQTGDHGEAVWSDTRTTQIRISENFVVRLADGRLLHGPGIFTVGLEIAEDLRDRPGVSIDDRVLLDDGRLVPHGMIGMDMSSTPDTTAVVMLTNNVPDYSLSDFSRLVNDTVTRLFYPPGERRASPSLAAGGRINVSGISTQRQAYATATQSLRRSLTASETLGVTAQQATQSVSTFAGIKVIVNELLAPDQWYVCPHTEHVYIGKTLNAEMQKKTKEGTFIPPWVATPPARDE